MKLIRAEKEQFAFSVNLREKQFFCKMLSMFPLVPPAHHRLNKTNRGKPRPEDQLLLDEAVAEQRRENGKRVQVFLNDPERFRKTTHGFLLSILRAEIEWLLQVLNDVRVGAWLALGEPDELTRPKPSSTNAPYIFALEISGYFQVGLLAALGVHEPTEPTR
ncbi:MAG: hypothetical protein ABI042_11390 [Verrucomicrobiota bacterium]